MKGLVEYITEDKLMSKLNLSGIPNSKHNEEGGFNTKGQKTKLAKEQEQFFVKRFKEGYPHVKAMTSEEYFGNEYSFKNDLEYGDIVLIKPSGEEIFIDLKVASLSTPDDKYNKKFYGTVNLHSILNFGKESNFYYLCVNKYGTDFILVRSKELYNFFNSDKCYLNKSKSSERKPDNTLLKYKNKFKDTNVTDVSYNDYIPSIFSHLDILKNRK